MKETTDPKYKYYLRDLGQILMDRAKDAQSEKKGAPRGTSPHDYATGRLMAFNEVISIMQQQAKGFSIPLEDLRLNGVDPDKDLI